MRNSILPSLLLVLCTGLHGCSGDSSATDELPSDAAADTPSDQSTTDGGSDGDGSADGDSNTCSPPNLLCQGLCVDPKKDLSNCGTCGKACDPGQICSAGKCDLLCSGGTEKCGNACVDTKLDTNNCGACGKLCDIGQVCSAGKCDLLCSGGTDKCGNACVDTKTNPANCGTCGTACPSGESCVASKCEVVCAGGTSKCGSLCVKLEIDPKNCATCGTVCEENGICDAGHCKIPVPNGVVCFASFPDIPNRDVPRFVTGDFNQDNLTDVIVNGTLMFARGNGTFRAVKLSRNLAGGYHPVVGDVNGDGFLDVVSGGGGHTIFTDIYNGIDDFQHAEYDTLVTPTSIAIGELNGDSFADLVFVSQGANVQGIMFNNGDGTFAAPVLSSEASPGPVLVIDLNGDKINEIHYPAQGAQGESLYYDFDNDGDLDLASTGYNGLTLRWNNGSKYAYDSYFHNKKLTQLAMADLNGDGKMDIVGSETLDSQGFEGIVNLYSFINLGQQKFEEKLLVKDRITSFAFGDLTQDGKPEMLALGDKFSDLADMSLQVLRNRGQGSFAQPLDRKLSHSFENIISADLNLDGKVDLIALDKSMYIYYNIGNGEFADPVVVSLPLGARWVNSGDTNSDGMPDLLVTGDNWAKLYPNTINGFGPSFAAPIAVPWFDSPNSDSLNAVRLTDFNGDGRLDILSNSYARPFVFVGQGNGHFLPGKLLVDELVLNFDTADLNDDGRSDFVGVGYKLNIWSANADATFSAKPDASFSLSSSDSLPAGAPKIADLDGDSKPDIVFTAGTGTVRFLFNNGLGTYEESSLIYSKYRKGSAITVVDLNNDYLPDLVIPDDQETNSVGVLLNQGGRKFSQEYRYRTNQKPDLDASGNNRYGKVFFLDVNSDGTPDLITDGGKAFKGMRILLNGCGI